MTDVSNPTENSFVRAARWAALFLIAALTAGFCASCEIQDAGKSPSMTSQAGTEVAADNQTGKLERLTLLTANGTRTLEVEVARTPEQQMTGLMFRKSLADDRGMLFEYDNRELTMWMRNTYIPLDMVFIRADGTVHRIEAMTEPHSERVIASQGDVAAVLEIAGGNAQRFGLKPGDTVKHPFFKAN
jgi:uncharacterized protein